MSDESRTEFGPLLKQAREKRGVSLQQVAATTKISARVLEALERNDPSKLPGGIFSRAFVRAYAREVGLDPELTVQQFVAAFPTDVEEVAPQAASKVVDSEGFESRRRAATALIQIAGLSLLVILIAIVYMNLRPAPTVPAEKPAAAVPARSAAPQSAPVTAAETPQTSPVAGDPADSAAPGASPAAAVPGSPAPVAAAPQPSSASGTEAPLLAPSADAPLAVSILATEDCWLSLTVDGTKVVGRILKPGERVQFRARTAMVISAGNAAGLTLTLNGKPARPLGGQGQVVTTTITVDSFKNFLQ